MVDPFPPTGPFLAPKLIVLIKYLISFLFFKQMFLYAEQDVNIAWQSCLALKS